MHTYLSIYLFNYLFLFSFFISFIDIDECTLQTDACSANSVCTNVDGSFNCECQPGFTGDGETCNGRLIKNIKPLSTYIKNIANGPDAHALLIKLFT